MKHSWFTCTPTVTHSSGRKWVKSMRVIIIWKIASEYLYAFSQSTPRRINPDRIFDVDIGIKWIFLQVWTLFLMRTIQWKRPSSKHWSEAGNWCGRLGVDHSSDHGLWRFFWAFFSPILRRCALHLACFCWYSIVFLWNIECFEFGFTQTNNPAYTDIS